MKRSEINTVYHEAKACFASNGWALPPKPRWDITDFGLGDFDRFGLVLINVAEEPEYCEKLMYARKGQTTPANYHAFWPETEGCIIGEVSTANDDANDNFFVDPDVGRFPGIEEDGAAQIRLISEGEGSPA